MKMTTNAVAVSLALSLSVAPVLAGCGGDVDNGSNANDNSASSTTQMTANDTKSDQADTSTTTSNNEDADAAKDTKTEAKPVSAALPDSLGLAKITAINGTEYAADFGEVTTPSSGDVALEFAPDGTSVTFDISYVVVYDSEGLEIAPEAVEGSLQVGDIVDLGGQGEGDDMIITSLEMLNADGTAKAPTITAADDTGTGDEVVDDTTGETAESTEDTGEDAAADTTGTEADVVTDATAETEATA